MSQRRGKQGPRLVGLMVQQGSDPLCACEDNGCAVALKPDGNLALFNAEQLFRGTAVKHCDCIVIRRVNKNGRDTIIIMSIELKNISQQIMQKKNILKNKLQKYKLKDIVRKIINEALSAENLSDKCRECLQKAEGLLQYIAPDYLNATLEKYCVVAVPDRVLTNIPDHILGRLGLHRKAVWRDICNRAWMTVCGGHVDVGVRSLYP